METIIKSDCKHCGEVIEGDKPYNFCSEECEQGYAAFLQTAAAQDVINNANRNQYKEPNLQTLLEEVAEAILASRGKHEHPLRYELIQIGGICINIARRLDLENA